MAQKDKTTPSLPLLTRTTARHDSRRFGYGGAVTIVGAPAGSITIEGWQRSEVDVSAEIELSALSRQCLDRRLPDRPTLEAEVAAWVAARNAEAVTVDWQFTTADARIKLKHLYPILAPVE